MPNVLDHAFLVQVTPGNFVVDLDGRTISTTSVPSAALHLSYERADMLVQDLRRRTYRQAIATDYLGLPVDAESLRAAVNAERSNPTTLLPQTRDEYDRLPAKEQMKLWRDPATHDHVVALEQQPRVAPKPRQA